MSGSGAHANPALPALLLARTLIALGILLTAIHVWFHLTWRGMHGTSDDLLLWTDLRWDLGPFSWVSWVALASVGVVAWRAGNGQPRREWWGFKLTGGLFGYLALDDAFTVHEQVGALAEFAWPELRVYGWTVVMLPGLAAVGLASFVFLARACWHVPGRRRLLVAGFGCMGLAVLAELGEPQLYRSGLRCRGFLLTEYQQTLEELLELIGPALLLCCVARLRAERDVPERAERDVTARP